MPAYHPVKGGVSMEREKDVFDRALEFLGNKWLEKNGIQGYVAKSVHIEEDEAPKKGTAGE